MKKLSLSRSFLLAGLACGASLATFGCASAHDGDTRAENTGEAARGHAPARPAFCPAVAEGLVDVANTPAGPYFVHHPAAGHTSRATIFFVPGGPGSQDTAQATFELWLSRGDALGDYRVVIPYSAAGDLTVEGDRLVPVLDEALGCYGSKTDRVHLAGTSNGGRAAFALMLRASSRFVSLLGEPGLFPSDASDDVLVAALTGKPVFNGAGQLDDVWRPLVKSTNDRLVGLGLDSVFVEIPNQSHILDETADQNVFFDFWDKH
jgi:predicted esterase